MVTAIDITSNSEVLASLSETADSSDFELSLVFFMDLFLNPVFCSMNSVKIFVVAQRLSPGICCFADRLPAHTAVQFINRLAGLRCGFRINSTAWQTVKNARHRDEHSGIQNGHLLMKRSRFTYQFFFSLLLQAPLSEHSCFSRVYSAICYCVFITRVSKVWKRLFPLGWLRVAIPIPPGNPPPPPSRIDP